MIRIDAAWLATAPLDMRAGTDTALARVVTVFGAAHPHHAYLFANKRANRIKVLVHDGIGIWLAARRLHCGVAFLEYVLSFRLAQLDVFTCKYAVQALVWFAIPPLAAKNTAFLTRIRI